MSPLGKFHIFSYLILALLAPFPSIAQSDPASAAGVPSLETTRAKAEAGDADAQVNLASAYFNGDGVAQDYTESLKWLYKAAAQNNAYAQYNIGEAYQHGHGVNSDDAEAAKWFEKSAEGGLSDAQDLIGWLYYYGQGVPQNMDQAEKWWTKAAAQGNAHSQSALNALAATRQRQKNTENISGIGATYCQAYEGVLKDDIRRPDDYRFPERALEIEREHFSEARDIDRNLYDFILASYKEGWQHPQNVLQSIDDGTWLKNCSQYVGFYR